MRQLRQPQIQDDQMQNLLRLNISQSVLIAEGVAGRRYDSRVLNGFENEVVGFLHVAFVIDNERLNQIWITHSACTGSVKCNRNSPGVTSTSLALPWRRSTASWTPSN